MAKLLLGSEDSLFTFNSTVAHEVLFMACKRRIFKDEIKKGNTSINIQISGTGAGSTTNTLSLVDTNAASVFTVGAAGDEAKLYSGSTAVGSVHYNAGIIVFTTGAFTDGLKFYWSGSTANQMNMFQSAITGNMDNFIYGFRQRINQVQFLNQTNLHSTIYFCRALNSDFNYSTNPSFVDADGRIIPTSGSDNQTRTYITTLGLYDVNENLLAVAKLSEPVKKDPSSEIVVRARLSY